MADEKEEIHETLTLQLSELEILSSMFVAEKELKIDQDSLVEIQEYLSGAVNVIPKQLTFLLFIFSTFDDDTSVEKESVLEVNCCLPNKYPQERPVVYARCNALTRELQKELNEQIDSYLKNLDQGELCVVTLVQWLRETWCDFSKKCRLQVKDEECEKEKDVKLTRIWLYMHHIYSKTKRKHILEWAHEANLTGFSLPGKPGVVCIEGDERDTEEYFSRLRRLNWKKITCRHKEPELAERSFEGFQELVFHVHGSGDDRMNLGEFFQYLVKRNLGPMFKVLFGIEGKMN